MEISKVNRVIEHLKLINKEVIGTELELLEIAHTGPEVEVMFASRFCITSYDLFKAENLGDLAEFLYKRSVFDVNKSPKVNLALKDRDMTIKELEDKIKELEDKIKEMEKELIEKTAIIKYLETSSAASVKSRNREDQA